ncbi:MAG: type II toxin-antitoxin system VapC family toxin [Acidobacteria bacterium]|nr:type II toxin-antitoxin system VapC family toxin [Acidobacteriota bacterium]
MKLLIDSNVFLEVLLEQADSDAAEEFLARSDQHDFFVSDFSLHSISLIVLRHKSLTLLETFLADTILSGSVAQISIPALELNDVLSNMHLLKLDFDDSYQYTLAEKNGLTLVSFDKDFDHTPNGRQTPQAINQIT